MKRILTAGTLAAALLCGSGTLAQNSTPPTDRDSATNHRVRHSPRRQRRPVRPRHSGGDTRRAKIAPGSVIPVALTKSVDAKKAKTGDEIVAMVTMDMKVNTGEVIVPKDTKVVGHVTEAQARSKEQKESQLAIAFDQAVLKNQQVPLPMSIQAVIGQQNNSNNDNSGGMVGSAPAESFGYRYRRVITDGGAQSEAKSPEPAAFRLA